MIRRALLALTCAAGAACGDSIPHVPPLDAVSGDRLKLQRLRYDDGAEQVDPSGFYDTALHTRCAAGRWTDGALRCLPVADDAVYTDADCTTEVGLTPATELADPTVFIGHDWVDGVRIATRLHRAGDDRAAITEYWERRDGACTGPWPAPEGATTYELAGAITAAELVAFHDGEAGDGRLGLRLRQTDDGLRLAIELRDRELDVACTPTLRSDGVACEPSTVAAATYFDDPGCEQPRVVTAEPAPRPAIARVVDDAGCATYFRIGPEVSPPSYRREAAACVRATVPSGARSFELGAAVELALLGRTVEDAGGRRLQRVILDDAGLRFVGDRLVDTATRAECLPRLIGDELRCVPAATVAALTLYARGCVAPLRVAAVPTRVCGERPAFAIAVTADGTAIHAIGDRVDGPLFAFDGVACAPYVAPPDTAVHALGPALAPETFTRAVAFGAR